MNALVTWRARFEQALSFLLILLLAVELRLLFRTGLADIDALVYSQFARNMADGIFRLNYEGVPFSATARVGLYGPVAVLYALFGSSDVTTFAWPFICALLGVAFAYGIGRKVAGESAGLLAAFLWAVLPTGVAASTALMGDGPIAALSMGVVYFLLVAESATGPRFFGALAAGLVCLLVGLASKPAISLLVVFLVVYAIWKRPKNRLAWLGLGAALIGLLLAYSVYTSQTSWSMSWLWLKILPSASVLATASTDWWSHVVLGSPEFAWIAPLWIVAIAVLVAQRQRQAYVPIVWFSSIFLYLEFGTRSLAFYEPITTASLGTGITRHFLLVAAPATIVGGIYLAQGLRVSTARWISSIAVVVTAAIAWIGMRHATNLDWGITGETMLPFEAKSALAGAVVIFGAIASPLATAGVPARWKSVALTVLCLAIGVASLNLSYRAATTYRAVWPQTMTEAVRYFEKNAPLPILVQNEIFAQRLDYSSGFKLGFTSVVRDQKHPRIFLAPQDSAIIHDAYVLVDDYYLRTSHVAQWGDGPAYFSQLPPTFVEVARFGDRKNYQMRLYQVSDAAASVRLKAARTAVQAASNPQTLREWLMAAGAAREFCEATSAWEALRRVDVGSLTGYDPLPLVRECAAVSPELLGPNLFQNGDFAKGTQDWSTHPDAKTTPTVAVDGKEHVWHATWTTGNNWGVIAQEQMLKPDTVYFYEGDLKSTAPVLSLYWQSDVGRFADFEHKYKEWGHVRYVFMTPHWNGQPMRVSFNPVLMKGTGDVWIKNLRIAEFSVPKTSAGVSPPKS